MVGWLVVWLSVNTSWNWRCPRYYAHKRFSSQEWNLHISSRSPPPKDSSCIMRIHHKISSFDYDCLALSRLSTRKLKAARFLVSSRLKGSISRAACRLVDCALPFFSIFILRSCSFVVKLQNVIPIFRLFWQLPIQVKSAVWRKEKKECIVFYNWYQGSLLFPKIEFFL